MNGKLSQSIISSVCTVAINKQETSGCKWQEGSSNRKMMNIGYRNSTRLEDETKALIKTLKKHKNPKNP